MAKSKSNPNTNPDPEDDNLKTDDTINDDSDPSVAEIEEEANGESVVTYNMGSIEVEGSEEEEPDLDLKKIQTEEEEDVEWVDSEYSLEDKDDWQELENYDSDNPYGDDDDSY